MKDNIVSKVFNISACSMVGIYVLMLFVIYYHRLNIYSYGFANSILIILMIALLIISILAISSLIYLAAYCYLKNR